MTESAAQKNRLNCRTGRSVVQRSSAKETYGEDTSLGSCLSSRTMPPDSGQDVISVLKASIAGWHSYSRPAIDPMGNSSNLHGNWTIPQTNVADRDYFKRLRSMLS